jgi:hypothetical protein
MDVQRAVTVVCLLAGTNIAFRKPANQSTTVRGGAASNGNDGERTTVHDGKRCTETMKEASPWWMVDLLRPYSVGVVRVTTRGCCGNGRRYLLLKEHKQKRGCENPNLHVLDSNSIEVNSCSYYRTPATFTLHCYGNYDKGHGMRGKGMHVETRTHNI